MQTLDALAVLQDALGDEGQESRRDVVARAEAVILQLAESVERGERRWRDVIGNLGLCLECGETPTHWIHTGEDAYYHAFAEFTPLQEVGFATMRANAKKRSPA